MIKKFYCQLDYGHVKYPSPVGSKNGNLADNGCGVCVTSMLIESMTGTDFPPEAAAEFSKRVGAREGFGTNFYILAGALAGRFGLTMRPTEDIERVADELRRDPCAKAVANVRGDRDGYIGAFSNGGHYVLIDGINADEMTVYDPMFRPGRYDAEGRRGRVRTEGFAAYADKSVLRDDCFERPFFIFYK